MPLPISILKIGYHLVLTAFLHNLCTNQRYKIIGQFATQNILRALCQVHLLQFQWHFSFSQMELLSHTYHIQHTSLFCHLPVPAFCTTVSLSLAILASPPQNGQGFNLISLIFLIPSLCFLYFLEHLSHKDVCNRIDCK